MQGDQGERPVMALASEQPCECLPGVAVDHGSLGPSETSPRRSVSSRSEHTQDPILSLGLRGHPEVFFHLGR